MNSSLRPAVTKRLRARIEARFEPHEIGGGVLTLDAEHAAKIATAEIAAHLTYLRRRNAELTKERDTAVANLEQLQRRNTHLRIERDAAILLSTIRRELLHQAVHGLESTGGLL